MNAQEKAAKTAVLRTQFPVSSGNDHRSKESEWVPVTTADGVSSAAATDEKVFYETPSNVSRRGFSQTHHFMFFCFTSWLRTIARVHRGISNGVV